MISCYFVNYLINLYKILSLFITNHLTFLLLLKSFKNKFLQPFIQIKLFETFYLPIAHFLVREVKKNSLQNTLLNITCLLMSREKEYKVHEFFFFKLMILCGLNEVSIGDFLENLYISLIWFHYHDILLCLFIMSGWSCDHLVTGTNHFKS